LRNTVLSWFATVRVEVPRSRAMSWWPRPSINRRNTTCSALDNDFGNSRSGRHALTTKARTSFWYTGAMKPCGAFPRGAWAARAASTSRMGMPEIRQFWRPISSRVRFIALATVDADSFRSMAIAFGLSPSSTRSIMRKPRSRDGQRGALSEVGSTIK
jgi:hypothetical protein